MKNLRYIVKPFEVYIGSHKGWVKSPLNRVLEHRALAELPSILVSPYTSSSVRTPKRFSISNQFSNEYLRYNGCKKSRASRIFDLFKGSRIWSAIFICTIVLLKPNHSRRWFKSQQAFHLAVHFQDDWGVLSETYFLITSEPLKSANTRTFTRFSRSLTSFFQAESKVLTQCLRYVWNLL